jgi:hypothetical protein
MSAIPNPPETSATLPTLTWAASGGSLAEALGLTSKRCRQIEAVLTRAMNGEGGVRHVLDVLQAEMRDLSFEEWTASVFMVGSFRYGTTCTAAGSVTVTDCTVKDAGGCHVSEGDCIGHDSAVLVTTSAAAAS